MSETMPSVEQLLEENAEHRIPSEETKIEMVSFPEKPKTKSSNIRFKSGKNKKRAIARKSRKMNRKH